VSGLFVADPLCVSLQPREPPRVRVTDNTRANVCQPELNTEEHSVVNTLPVLRHSKIALKLALRAYLRKKSSPSDARYAQSNTLLTDVKLQGLYN
jgi:hypothetical protein